jgi:hypothetical protein
MTEKQNQTPVQLQQPDNWAGAFKEFFRQAGAITTLLIIVLSLGQCNGCVDIYRLLGK